MNAFQFNTTAPEVQRDTAVLSLRRAGYQASRETETLRTDASRSEVFLVCDNSAILQTTERKDRNFNRLYAAAFKSQLLKAAYPLTNRGLLEVWEYVQDGDTQHLDWLKRNNPPGAELAPTLRALTPEQLTSMWSKLTSSLAAQVALCDAKAKIKLANDELRDALHPEEAAARQAAAEKEMADWWEREGKAESEIEERGESKYYYYEKSLGVFLGEEYTPQDYLSGRRHNEALQVEQMKGVEK